MGNIIEVRDLIKVYGLYPNKSDKIKALLNLPNNSKDFYALNGINLTIGHGESVGLIGLNGSGKSTLANIIAGFVPETSGNVIRRGTVSLLAIAAGLDNELSGYDNIELKCLMHGLSKKEILKITPGIIEFSELGDFINQPVKNYSSGMKSRLGFAISIYMNPDVFIIDEALSVGDSGFANKCLEKLKEYKANGKSMIFVSHSVAQMREFCDRIIWLESGRVKAVGKSDKVLHHYSKFVNSWKKLPGKEKELYKAQAYSQPIYPKLIEEDLILYELGNSSFEWDKKNNAITSHFVSRLCHFKSSNTRIYNDPLNLKDYIYSNDFIKKVYFSKKEIVVDGEVYSLLSKEESFTNNIVGWVRKEELSVMDFKFVSEDIFMIRLNGKGASLSSHWGGGSEIVKSNLERYENTVVKVFETVLVGSNTWFKIILDDKYMWVHKSSTNFI